MKAKVDVIIPLYNCRKYIAKAINSVLNQSIPLNKIIVVDDGSTDDSADEVKKLLSSNSALEYHYKKNGGLSSARNYGIKKSSSKYIAFLDADDYWHPQKIEKQLELFEKSKYENLGVVYCDFENVDESGRTVENKDFFQIDKTVKGNVFDKIILGNKIASSGSGVLVKKDCFDKVGLFDETLPSCEDWDMWLRIASTFNFDYVDEKLVYILRHDNNMSSNSRRMVAGLIKVLNKWVKQANSKIHQGWKRTFYIDMVACVTKDVLALNCKTLKLMSPSLRKSFLKSFPTILLYYRWGKK